MKFKIKAFVPSQSIKVDCDDIYIANKFLEYMAKCGVKKFIVEVIEKKQQEKN